MVDALAFELGHSSNAKHAQSHPVSFSSKTHYLFETDAQARHKVSGTLSETCCKVVLTALPPTLVSLPRPQVYFIRII